MEDLNEKYILHLGCNDDWSVYDSIDTIKTELNEYALEYGNNFIDTRIYKICLLQNSDEIIKNTIFNIKNCKKELKTLFSKYNSSIINEVMKELSNTKNDI